MWHSLGEAVTKTVAAHHACVRAGYATTQDGGSPAGKECAVAETRVDPAGEATAAVEAPADVCAGEELQIITRTRQRFTEIQALRSEGVSLSHCQ